MSVWLVGALDGQIANATEKTASCTMQYRKYVKNWKPLCPDLRMWNGCRRSPGYLCRHCDTSSLCLRENTQLRAKRKVLRPKISLVFFPCAHRLRLHGGLYKLMLLVYPIWQVSRQFVENTPGRRSFSMTSLTSKNWDIQGI